MRVILLRDLDLGKQVTIKLQCCGQMVERLLKVSVLKVRFAKLSVGGD